MERRLEITTKSNIKDVIGDQLAERIKKALNLQIHCRYVDVYCFAEKLSENEMRTLAQEVFTDPITQEFSFAEPLFKNSWRIEITLLPGVFDHAAYTTSEAIKDRSGRSVELYHSRMYSFSSEIDESTCDRIASLLSNSHIERYFVYAPGSNPESHLPKVNIIHEPTVQKISLHMGKERFEALARERSLPLSNDEFTAIKTYFKNERFVTERNKYGLDNKITDVELEAIAQLWCASYKNKIFNAQINYEEDGEKHAINSIFRTFICGATEQIKKPYVVAAFKDNGGIIKFNHAYDIAINTETHTTSAILEPYSSALNCFLNNQREILSIGLGANPIASIDVLCFGLLNTKTEDIPNGIPHPLNIYNGVIHGINHGGRIGVPIVNGSIIFDKDYTCLPTLSCCTVGLMPSNIKERRTCDKVVEPGFLIVLVGERIGRDGLHRNTLPTISIDSSLPHNTVQIGNPTAQKKLLDFVLEARDKLLYEAGNNVSKGGIPSSVINMAQSSGGCDIYLDKCPLKYSGLDPWEILLSESQERMLLAVRPEWLNELLSVAKFHNVEATVIGKFTKSGKFHVTYRDQTIAYLDLDFLRDGVLQVKLKASWKKFMYPEPIVHTFDPKSILRKLLLSPNITSRESVIRKYDHEILGTSVIKPMMGGPNDAAVLRPVYNSDEGLIISHGICPRYCQDGYLVTALAFDEAVRNAIAVGAKFGYLACAANFSWPDPIKSIYTPDGEQKLGALVRACLALYDCVTSYGIPAISCQNNLKNDHYIGDRKYSIPSTVLISVIGKIGHIKRAVSSEFKKAGDFIYILGTTRDEFGGSEFYRLFGGIGNSPPQLHPEEHVPVYKALSDAIEQGFVVSAHDISDGGLAVAFAESALGFGIGAEIDLDHVPAETAREDAILFAESAGRFVVSVSPENVEKFERIMHGTIFKKAGRVRGDKRFLIKRGDQIIINDSVDDIRQCYFAGIETI